MSTEAIEVSLGKEGGIKTFANAKEIQDWLQKETQFWQKLLEPDRSEDRSGSIVHQHISENLSTLRGVVTQFCDAKNPAPDVRVIRKAFQQAHETNGIMASGYPRANFLSRLRAEEGFGMALGACAFFLNSDIRLRSGDGYTPGSRLQTSCLRGAMEASYFNNGFSDRVTAEKTSLERLRSEWEQMFQGFRAKLNNETDQHEALTASAKLQLEEQKTSFINLMAEAQSKKTLLEATYNKHMQLEAPVTYWNRRAWVHCGLAWLFGLLSLGVGALLYSKLSDLFKEMLSPPAAPSPLVDQWHPEYWFLAAS